MRVHKGRIEAGIAAFSQTDLTDDLMQIAVPVPVMHGDDDQIFPHAAAGQLSAKLLKDAKDLQVCWPWKRPDTIGAIYSSLC